jgi:hypothetical protein
MEKEVDMNQKIETLSREIHQLYCEEYKKQNGKDYWTKGNYDLLAEKTKEFDRNIAKWHLQKIMEYQIEKSKRRRYKK